LTRIGEAVWYTQRRTQTESFREPDDKEDNETKKEAREKCTMICCPFGIKHYRGEETKENEMVWA